MITKFQKKVYEEVKKIPRGKVTTYGEIARKLRTSPRAVGNALRKNFFSDVPCHRVIKSNGEIGGYKGKNHKKIKRKIFLLRKEGIKIKNKKIPKSFLIQISSRNLNF